MDRWPRVPIDDTRMSAETAPLVSVVVPARDEARSIRRCVRSLLAQHYPSDRVRLVVVDDESRDGTGDLVAELARTHERLRLVAGTPLPHGSLSWPQHAAGGDLNRTRGSHRPLRDMGLAITSPLAIASRSADPAGAARRSE